MFPPGTLIHNERYRIVGPIGRGGFGAIYEAIDERLDRRVALKQLLLAGDDVAQQFRREARLLANLEHPALPRVTDYFTDATGQFLVLDFVPGHDLSEQLRKQGASFPVERVLAWADQLLDALRYLHTRKPPIIHRDIKPHNLKLRSDGRVMLLDFGLAKGEAGYGAAGAVSTQYSIMAYTRGYAALEQIEGTGTDERTDLYSLGATLYCLLTKEPPMDAEKRALVVQHSGHDPVRPPHELNPQVPEEVSRVLMQALALEPDRRPQSAQEMERLLKAAFDPNEVLQGTARTGATQASQQEDTVVAPPDEEMNKMVMPVVTPLASLTTPTRGEAPEAVETEINTVGLSSSVATARIDQDSMALEPPAKKRRLWALTGTGLLVVSLIALTIWALPLDRVGSNFPVVVVAPVREITIGEEVRSVAFSPLGDTIGVGSAKGASLWRASTGDKIVAKDVFTYVESVAFMPMQGDMLLAGSSWDHSIRLWSTPNLILIQELKVHTDTVDAIAISDVGLASTSQDGKVLVWTREVDASKRITWSNAELEVPEGTVSSLAYSINGELAGGTTTGIAITWVPGSLSVYKRFEDPTVRGKVTGVTFSPDGKLLAASAEDGHVRVWTVDDGKLLRTLKGHTDMAIDVAFSPDGETLASGSADDTLRLWRVSDGLPLAVLKGHTGDVWSLAFSTDGTRLASGGRDSRMLLWDVGALASPSVQAATPTPSVASTALATPHPQMR